MGEIPDIVAAVKDALRKNLQHLLADASRSALAALPLQAA